MKTLDPIFPITSLQKHPAEVKEAARKDIVRITENGVGAFVFTSEDMYERRIREAAEKAVEEALLANAIERGRADIAAGCYLVGDDAWAEIERRVVSNA